MSTLDLNPCFPLPAVLENARLKLVPWDPEVHTPIFVEKASSHPELFNWLPFGPFDSSKDFNHWFNGRIQSQRSQAAFAVFDKTRDEKGSSAFAGMVGFLNASEVDLSAEIGFILILPAFQRTHVASNAAGLLLQYCLNTPSTGPDDDSSEITGLGLRRVSWSADKLNPRSVALAERIGMKVEGIFRWHRVLPTSRTLVRAKVPMREGDPKADQPGRDTVYLAICWDDWVEGGAERLRQVMERVA